MRHTNDNSYQSLHITVEISSPDLHRKTVLSYRRVLVLQERKNLIIYTIV